MRTTAVAATTEWKQQAQKIAADGVAATGMFLGSVSHGAVHHAHCSVAVVR